MSLSGENNEDDPIVAAEVEVIKNAAHTAEEGISSLIYAVAKKMAAVGAIYLVGYRRWSMSWLIAPVIYFAVRDQFKEANKRRIDKAKASAMTAEKEFILERIDELPTWVYFPDVERCEWVNRILKQVWPNANYYAHSLLKDTIEPSIAKALAKIKLSGFRFDRIILGTIPPRIGGVKIYDKNVDRNEIIMDMDIFYASDCDINFYLVGVKGGIKDFQIYGLIRVVMKPLIRSMPLVGGLQIFFLNNPNVDFSLVGVIEILETPGLSGLIRRIIVEQIGAVMVLPNKLPIRLSDDFPAVSLKMPEPMGILRVHVVEAKDLMKKDITVLGRGKSDPYAIITVGSQEFKTQIVENTVNPTWDFWCEAVVEVTQQVLVLRLFDWDRIGHDESLGRASVDISKVLKNGLLDTWLTLEEAKSGLLHVRLIWYKLTSDPHDLRAALLETQLLRRNSISTALLIVFIDSAKYLPHPRQASRPDPYVVVMVGKQTKKTEVQMRNDSPVWEQGFTFLVRNPDHEILQIKIIDQKTGNEIGSFTYMLSILVAMKGMQIVLQPFPLQKSGPDSKIIMKLVLKVLKRADSTDDNSSNDASSRAASVSTAYEVEEANISSMAKDIVLASVDSFIVE